MPINFSELVDRIDQRNLQNRQQMVAQMKPFLDVLTRKATYEMEKQKAKEETAAGLKVAGEAMGLKDYTPDTSLSPDMQKFTFNLEADRQAPLKQWEAFSSVYGIEPPANLKDMTPEMATVSLGKAKEDHATSEAINATLSMYPEIAKKLMTDEKFNSANLKVKRAMLEKELGDDEAKKKFVADVALYKAKSDIDTNEYWRTTGTIQQQKINATGAGGGLSDSQKKAMSRKALYETTGVSINGYKVKIGEQAGNKIATTLSNGKSIKKTENGYYLLDKDGKWRTLIVDPDDKDSLLYVVKGVGRNTRYKNAAKALDSAMTDYDLQTGNTLEPLMGTEQPAATTNPDFDDLF